MNEITEFARRYCHSCQRRAACETFDAYVSRNVAWIARTPPAPLALDDFSRMTCIEYVPPPNPNQIKLFE